MRYKTNKNDILQLTSELSTKAPKLDCPIIMGFDDDQLLNVLDISSLGNIIMGGVTGSGKSVFIHSLICSLLLRFNKTQCQLFLADPKMVDLVIYKNVPILNKPVLTNPKEILDSLQAVIDESSLRVNNVKSYPNLFVIVDTFSDIFFYNKSDFIDKLKIISKNSKITNIHLLISDSRVSSELYTPELLSLFDTKIAFIQYDNTGSEVLLGNDSAKSLINPGEMIISSANIETRLKSVDTSEETINLCIGKIK